MASIIDDEVPYPGQLRSPPAHYQATRRAAFRMSTDSTVTALPEYTTSPPLRPNRKPLPDVQYAWASTKEDVEVLPDYKSPPNPTVFDGRYTRGTLGFISEDEVSSVSYDGYSQRDPSPSPRPRHRYQPSTVTEVNEDEEFDARLDKLLERSVQALELSNQLLAQPVDDNPRSPGRFHYDRPRSSEMRGRSGDRRPVSTGRRREWVDESVMEEGEQEEEEEEGTWEDATYMGSLPERSYMSPSSEEYSFRRPNQPPFRSPHRLPTTPSLDSFRLPTGHDRHLRSPAYPWSYASQISPSPSPSRRSPSVRAPPPQPLNLSLAVPQLTTPSFHASTPAYKLVSSIVSREALQPRNPLSASRSLFTSSQPPTPTSSTPSIPIARSTSDKTCNRQRNASANPPGGRRKGGLMMSISVPKDIGKWMRSLESVQPALPSPLRGRTPEPMSPGPPQPRLIVPDLPPSPPLAPVSLSSGHKGVETLNSPPLTNSITQLRALLSLQPASASQPTPTLGSKRRAPQFLPVTPRRPSTALSRPPPTRSQSDPSIPANDTPIADNDTPQPQRKAKAKKRVDEPSEAASFPFPTSPPLRLPQLSYFIDWLDPGSGLPQRVPAAAKASPDPRKKTTGASRAGHALWTRDGRPDWSERGAESWQI